MADDADVRLDEEIAKFRKAKDDLRRAVFGEGAK
jgi:hypothetical protein